MDRDKAKKANELIEEIDELKEYREILRCGDGQRNGHFEFREHYGDSGKSIRISRRHNQRFIKVLDDIINEIEQKLLDL